MKTILVPIDFTAKSINALNYSVSLNKKMEASIVLFHAYYAPIPSPEMSVLVMPTNAEIRKDVKKSLVELKQKYEKLHPGMKFISSIVEGFPGTEIIEAENKIKSDLVILGAHQTNAFESFIMDSNMPAILEQSKCPVIAVPDNVLYKNINKIVFAANYGNDDYKNAFDIIEFAKIFNSEVVLLHISTNHDGNIFDFDQLSKLKESLVSETAYDKISIKLFEDENIYHGLNLYLEEIKADLFCISMRNRRFYDKIFKPSLTKKMVYHSQIPTMVFHTDYK